ncbi:MAG TPA: hypothetical protein VH120_17215 [Gemmataceae bacterium]|jgi:hypothetical protein|nr:hypothetical protein [Gemmataceae bacterium]
MPSWLIEGDIIVYLLLAFGFLVSLAGWWRTRKRPFAVAAGVFVILILAYWLLDRLVESDGEQMVRKVREVADAVSRNDLDAAFRNVSDHFDRHGHNKQSFRDFCRQVLKAGNVTSVKVWDEDATEVSRPTGLGSVQFRFKVTGNWGESPPNYIARVFFILDPDGQWRVRTFEIYDSLNQGQTPVPIPGWN